MVTHWFRIILFNHFYPFFSEMTLRSTPTLTRLFHASHRIRKHQNQKLNLPPKLPEFFFNRYVAWMDFIIISIYRYICYQQEFSPPDT